MITQLFRITPPGDGQANSNLNSLGVVAYEQTFDGAFWNARRGAQDIVVFPQIPRINGSYTSDVITNYNSSFAYISGGFFGGDASDIVAINIFGIDVSTGYEYQIQGPSNFLQLVTDSPDAKVIANLPKTFKFIISIIGNTSPKSIGVSISLSGY